MKIWQIIVSVIIGLGLIGMGYFYYVGNQKEEESNVTVVRRMIDPTKSQQTTDNTQIDQVINNINSDISSLQSNKDQTYINEVINDLKSF